MGGLLVLSSRYRAVAVELCYCMQCRVLSLSFTEELATETSEKFSWLVSNKCFMHTYCTYN